MMHTKYNAVLLLVVLTLFSCKHGDKQHEYHSITDKIEAESKNYKEVPISSEQYLEDLKTVEVHEGDFHFSIPERKSQITSYKCTECHSKPLAELKSKKRAKKAHWNVKLNHAGDDIMNCTSCHSENDMDNLHSLTGRKIDFNLSYKLCSQCHSKQFEDWKGGAHGKKLGGWVNPRVSNTCVNCHNPHQPHFESRWPSRLNTQKIEERK